MRKARPYSDVDVTTQRHPKMQLAARTDCLSGGRVHQ
jgi:hypothetical protein